MADWPTNLIKTLIAADIVNESGPNSLSSRIFKTFQQILQLPISLKYVIN